MAIVTNTANGCIQTSPNIAPCACSTYNHGYHAVSAGLTLSLPLVQV